MSNGRVGSRGRSHLTLGLCTVLHAFTHAYGTMLVPLYLLMAGDLKLRGVSAAAMIVTLYGLTYNLGSYGAGVLADRVNRKALLGVGLIGNALAIAAMGLTRRYEMLVLLGIVGGAFGTLFHPSANALVPAHYPRSPGMAIGLLGMGSGLGFFAGPQFAGWRAEAARWSWGAVARWQKPCVELGALGVLAGIVFLVFAREARASGENTNAEPQADDDATAAERAQGRRIPRGPHLSASMRARVLAIAAVLSCRDFAGIATVSLLSIYLQKALGYDVKRAGLIVGGMMLLSIFANPIAVYFSPGRRRLPALVGVLIAGGAVLATVPWFAAVWVFPLMCAYQCFQLGSYAVSDAAMLERVDAQVRGRVVGLFLTIAGTVSSMAPWAMGAWTDALKGRAALPHAYGPIFATLAGLMWLAAFAAPLLSRLGAPHGETILPITETDPATMEVV